MKIREIIAIITKDGWFEVCRRGSHRQYKHAIKKGLVTIACHINGLIIKPTCVMPDLIRHPGIFELVPGLRREDGGKRSVWHVNTITRPLIRCRMTSLRARWTVF